MKLMDKYHMTSEIVNESEVFIYGISEINWNERYLKKAK